MNLNNTAKSRRIDKQETGHMKWILLIALSLSTTAFAHDIEDKDLLAACIATGVATKQVCTQDKTKAADAKKAYDEDPSWKNLQNMLKTKAVLVKCFTEFNIACVGSLKATLQDKYYY
jgi:hypothetical protein